MCTLTWRSSSDDAGGYEVFFNRDERRTRAPESPVVPSELGRVRCLAPRDSEAGGTWIAVNEYGVTVCLLNGYHASRGPAREHYESRGTLVLGLASATSLEELEERLHACDLPTFRPFVLPAFEPGVGGPLVHVWDGAELVRSEVRAPVVSSSVDREKATALRRAVYDRTVGDAPDSLALAAFHRSHANGPSADSTCMHREDAETRSLCHVRVERERVVFAHHHGSPCTEAPRTERELSRVTRWGVSPSPRP